MSKQVQQLQAELDEARAMALKVMAVSSEIGQITQFLKRSFNANSFKELAVDLLEHLASQGLRASISIDDSNGRMFFSLNQQDDMVDETVIARNQNAGRLVTLGDRLLVNYEHCSLLLENTPKDEEVLGNLRDNLAILMDGVEARVTALMMEKRAEDARRTKDAFFSLMSHELRTPLNPIIGFATRLGQRLSSKIEEKDLRALFQIREHGEHLLRQINDILDYLQMKSGSINLHPERTNIRQIVMRAMQEVEGLIDIHHPEIDATKIEEDLVFYGDPDRLRDILVGLLSNAVKYAPKGKVSVSVTSSHQAEPDDYLVIVVSDTGCGISADRIETIFNHFTEDSSGNPLNRIPSVGASLYIVNELVKLHGGTIVVESQVGKGSCFKVMLPGIGVSVH